VVGADVKPPDVVRHDEDDVRLALIRHDPSSIRCPIRVRSTMDLAAARGQASPENA
jgi:hypothetical protein